MILSFVHGYFYLTWGKTRALNKEPDDPMWVKVRDGVYQTQNLKAAASFKDHSDSNVKKIFNRTFSKRYDLPRLPQLPFLDPLQVEGVKWILTRSRSYLAHAPGAGKTVQAIVAAELTEGPGQKVFIVPPDLIANWQREIYKFNAMMGMWADVATVPLSNKKDQMDWSSDYILVPDSMLSRPWVYENLSKLKIKFIAVDEASRFKDPLSDRSAALFGGKFSGTKQYSGLHRKARHTVLLDGSPMPNRAMELWAPTYAMDPMTIDCMTQKEFGFKYCGAVMNDRGEWLFNGTSNEKILKAKLQKNFMQVVTEDQLDHPERLRSLLFINQDVRTPEHKAWERKNLQKETFSDLDEKLSQGDMARFRKELGLAKVPWTARYVADRLSAKNESILLFGWHREVCLQLKKALSKFDPFVVMGGVGKDEREAAFKQFQSGKRRLIIGNIAAMGRGHNLQKADRVIFIEPSWSDESNKQCEKRASRRGRDSSKGVRCEYVAAPNSMDELVYGAIFTKASRTKKVIG